MNTKRSFISAATLLGAATTFAIAQTAGGPAIKEFMREKLEASKRVLEGITLEDYELVARYARRLGAMSEEASWRAFDDREYVRQSETFRRSADELRKAATERNLDGMTLAYVKATMSCVECHKFVRGKKVTQLELRNSSREFTMTSARSLRERTPE